MVFSIHILPYWKSVSSQTKVLPGTEASELLTVVQLLDVVKKRHNWFQKALIRWEQEQPNPTAWTSFVSRTASG